MHFKSIHLVPAASSAKLYTFSCQPSLVYSSVKGHMIIMPMWCQQPKSLAQHPYVKVKMYGLSLGETDDEEADHTASKSGIERLKAGEHPQTQATSRISITVNFICHLEACSNRWFDQSRTSPLTVDGFHGTRLEYLSTIQTLTKRPAKVLCTKRARAFCRGGRGIRSKPRESSCKVSPVQDQWSYNNHDHTSRMPQVRDNFNLYGLRQHEPQHPAANTSRSQGKQRCIAKAIPVLRARAWDDFVLRGWWWLHFSHDVVLAPI